MVVWALSEVLPIHTHFIRDEHLLVACLLVVLLLHYHKVASCPIAVLHLKVPVLR
jgi:hypothetical protein